MTNKKSIEDIEDNMINTIMGVFIISVIISLFVSSVSATLLALVPIILIADMIRKRIRGKKNGTTTKKRK